MSPELSVVVASVNGFPYLGSCLDALTARCPAAEVIVADATDERTRERVRAGWPGVRLLSFDPGATVPELRAAGIFAASAPYVAVIEDHCIVQNGWADRLLAAHASGHEVVGGPIRNVATRRARDRAAFLCEYSEYMEPLPAGEPRGLPGMNVSYGRKAIAAMEDLLRAGLWETWWHARLRSEGFQLHADPAAVVAHDKDFGIREFLSQRYHYSRSYAGLRNPELGWKRVLYAVGFPLLPPLLTLRIARNAARRPGGLRLLAGVGPLVLLYVSVWALGEGIGYAFGGGRSLERVR